MVLKNTRTILHKVFLVFSTVICFFVFLAKIYVIKINDIVSAKLKNGHIVLHSPPVMTGAIIKDIVKKGKTALIVQLLIKYLTEL